MRVQQKKLIEKMKDTEPHLTIKSNIVFIHIGNVSPRLCLTHCIEQAMKEAPTSRIWLVSEAKHWKKIQDELSPKSRTRQLTLIDLRELPKQIEHETFLLTKNYPGGSGGFWQVTTERFFVLFDLMVRFELDAVTHLESDVMIYGDVPKIIDDRRNRARMLFPLDRTRGIASVFFAADKNILGKFCRFANENPSVHDMALLNRFYVAFEHQGDIASLPTIPESICVANSLDLKRYSRPNTEDWGIFDAAAIGQYLLGIDPRFDTALQIRFKNEESELSNYLNDDVFVNTEQGLTLKTESSYLPIRCVHVHSKRSDAMMKFNELPKRRKNTYGSRENIQPIYIYHSKIETLLPKSETEFVDLAKYHIEGTSRVQSLLFDILESKTDIKCQNYIYEFLHFHVLPFLDHPKNIEVIDFEPAKTGIKKDATTKHFIYRTIKTDNSPDRSGFEQIIPGTLVNYLNKDLPARIMSTN